MLVLGDTGLRLRIPSRVDDRHDEFRIGFGKTGRDGIALAPVGISASCDAVITNVVVLDPLAGIQVASIGITDGRISAIGKAGNPSTSDAVDVIVGSGTIVIPGEGLIATPGGIDTHVHSITPRVFHAEIASGVTTVLTQEAGPVWGVGLGSPAYLMQALRSMEAFPMNVGILGRASSSSDAVLREAVEGYACGFKVHEDTGATLVTVDTALRVAEEFDLQVALHTDGLNETLSVRDTLAVLDGRVIHAFHVEGCGGGHAPDVLELAGHDHVLASSTNPTLPYGSNAVAEHLDMILLVHGMNAHRDADRRIARARVRGVTMAAENRLHDLGVIAMTSSDAQGMGRAGETWWRTFALAAVQRELQHEATLDDNDRILRYLAKITINPALAHGLSHDVGRLAPGHLADIVLWEPQRFAAKPWLVLKSGFPAWGVSGDPNACIPDAEPVQIIEQFGAFGAAAGDLSRVITSRAALDEGLIAKGLNGRRWITVQGCRSVRGRDMVRHGVLGQVRVEPDGSRVTFDGVPLEGQPSARVPISRLHFW